MQNKFGLKDFVTLVLLLVIGLSIWLSMAQEDRRWQGVREMNQQVQRLEQQIAMMRQMLDEGVALGPRRGEPETERDDTWAYAGVEITWSDRFGFVSDPRQEADYALGGTFTETFGAQPPTITPLIFRDVYGSRAIDQVVEPLGRYHPSELHHEGVLAEAWQLDPEGLWLRVKIRDRARFSDGRPVTAEDVKFSHDLIMNDQIEAPRFRATYGLITEVKVLDEKVVEFHFEDSKFINIERALGMPILPKHFYEQFTPSQFNQSTGLLMGSGPFRLQGLDPDNQYRPGRDDIVLVRNEEYWGPRPALAALRFKVIREELGQITDYNNRGADMIQPTPTQFNRYRDDEEWLERNHAMEWYNIRGGYSFIAWNGGERDGRLTPFHDVRVRRAMTHLLDRERIIRNIMEGIGQVATGPFYTWTDQANPNITPHEYSLELARQLLAEAGWTERDGVLRNERGDRFTFEYTYPANVEAWERVSNYLRDQAARVGIRCIPRPVDWSIFVDIATNRDFDALSMAWSPTTPESDPYQVWHSDQIAGGGDNFAQWRNERADWLIETARQELDPAKRMEKWHELHQIIHDEQPYTFLVARPWLRFINRRSQNVHPYMTGLEQREFYMPIAHQASPF
jgi:peptide/nickel transport system substrate-binding protein